MKINSSSISGMETSIIYATNTFVKERSNDLKRNSIISRHNSVELLRNDFQQVLVIISVIEISESGENSLATLISGVAYEITAKNKFSILMPYPEIKYKFQQNYRGNLEITIFEFDHVLRPLCVIPQRQDWSLVEIPIRQLRMWCFDLAYIDRTTWEDYHTMYHTLTTEVYTEAGNAINNPLNFLMTADQLRRYSIHRISANENIQQGEEIFP